MLMSMPTSTSTIFGVFQVIGVSQALLRRDVDAGVKGKAAEHVTQAVSHKRCALQRFATIFSNFHGIIDSTNIGFREVDRKHSTYELSQQSQERPSSVGI
jgi:hypothetical protein